MKRIPLLLWLYILTITISAQTDMRFDFDYARFNYDSTSTYLEFYYELNPQNMQLTKTDKGNMIEAIVHIEMKNLATNEFFLNKNFKISDVVSDTLQKSLSGVFGFVVPEGKYSILVKAFDNKNNAFTKTIEEMLTIKPFKSGKYSASDIQLAYRIKKDGADPNSIFYKNTLEIFPNPSMTYSASSPVLFYYSELYNLMLDSPDKTFNLQKVLYNSQGKEISRSQKTIKQSTNAVVEIGTLNLAKYPTDSYTFVLNLVNPVSNEAYMSTKRFFLYNPSVSDSLQNMSINTQLLGSEFAMYSDEDCDLMFTQVKYISSKNEMEQYKKLDSLKAKREFLFQFWRNRDRDPMTTVNETKEDYMKLVKYADEHYSNLGKRGYLTDRGRVLLIFGEPDQRDIFTNEPNLKPHEIWFYNAIEGGVTFIFGDVTGFGNFELLHSTKIGEMSDENWSARLTVD